MVSTGYSSEWVIFLCRTLVNLRVHHDCRAKRCDGASPHADLRQLIGVSHALSHTPQDTQKYFHARRRLLYTYSSHFAAKSYLKRRDGKKVLANVLATLETKRWTGAQLLKWVFGKLGIVFQPVTGALQEAEVMSTRWMEEINSATEVAQRSLTYTCEVNTTAMLRDSGLTINAQDPPPRVPWAETLALQGG